MPTTKSVSAAEFSAAISALLPPTAPVATKDDGVIKLIVGGVIAFIGIIMMAVFLWVGTSVNDLSKSVTRMSANVDNLQKAITDLQQGQGATSKTTSDLQAQAAAGAARSLAIEQDVGRIKERVRILEGQPPISR